MDPNNEASKDPGIVSKVSFTDHDLEDHRGLTVYVGFHFPSRKRKVHKRRRHHHHHHHHQKENSFENSHHYEYDINKPVTPPSERVHFILCQSEDEIHEPHPVFSELDELYYNGKEVEWRETARWIKFEEDVEIGGNRWSKPHVATVSLHSLFELRNCLLNGVILLDVDAVNLENVFDLILDSLIESGQLKEDLRLHVKTILLSRHHHQHDRRNEWVDKGTFIPLIKSFAELGKSAAKMGSFVSGNLSSQNSTTDTQDTYLPSECSDASLCGTSKNIVRDINSFPALDKLNVKQSIMRKIPVNAETANILVGELDFLEQSVIAFVRLNKAYVLGDMTEVPIPTKFIFILLGPPCGAGHYHEIGRSFATVMSDEVFHDVAYKAKDCKDLLAGFDEFLDAVTILPPGGWDPAIRIEPPSNLLSQESRKKPETKDTVINVDEKVDEWVDNGLKRTGRLFGGLVADIKRKWPWYISDFKDFLDVQSIASSIFLYFACLAPIITFGGLLDEATNHEMGVMENLSSAVLSAIIYCLFSGQPLVILGSTGPMLIFESILYSLSRYWLHVDFLPFRFWIGLWSSLLLLVLVAVDASSLLCYITRFTEEIFAILISIIFAFKAFQSMFAISVNFPMKVNAELVSLCDCRYSVYLNELPYFNKTKLTKEECQIFNGTVFRDTCMFAHSKYVPDVFLLSVILFAGTFSVILLLKWFKSTPFFLATVRKIISDFSVIIAIVAMTLMDFILGINTPKLNVPKDFEPTLSERAWLISPFGNNSSWSAAVALIPAIFLTILIFMDQQITAVIVNRKENKLKKGCGYHLDLLTVSLTVAINSIFGLPWCIAATIISVSHVNSLKVESKCRVPGEKPQFIGVREQRGTQIFIAGLIGLSIFLSPLLKHIPMPVLYGVFLYMGVSALEGLQLYDRILIMLMPSKYQPDSMFLRHVPLKKVNYYTLIQVGCLIVLLTVNYLSAIISLFFPFMLLLIICVRKKILCCMFCKSHLKVLDNDIPEITKQENEEHSEKSASDKAQNPAINNVNNVTSTNSKVMNGNVNSQKSSTADCVVNISELLMESSIWKSIQQQSMKESQVKNKNSMSGKFQKKSSKQNIKIINKSCHSASENEGNIDGDLQSMELPSSDVNSDCESNETRV